MAESVAEKGSEGVRSSLPKLVGALAAELADRSTTGDVAELRRLRTEAPGGSAFWRLVVGRLEPAGVLPDADVPWRLDAEKRWAAILNGMARTVGLHRPGLAVGRALAEAEVSEARVTRLLLAHEATLWDALRVTVHHLGTKAIPFDWAELASLLLSDGRSDEDVVRRRVARSYYRAVAARAR